MKVILNVDMETFGEIGDIIDVKPGYARNYLFPRDLALEITKHNLEIIKARKKKVQKKLELEKLSAQGQKPKLEEITLMFEKKAGETGALFGSVTVSDIEKKLEELGVKIERKKFHLEEPIKRLGNHICKIKLFKDVEAELKIVVTAEGEDEQVGKGEKVEKEEAKKEEAKKEEAKKEEAKEEEAKEEEAKEEEAKEEEVKKEEVKEEESQSQEQEKETDSPEQE